MASALAPMFPPMLSSLWVRLSDNGLGAAMARAKARMELADDLEDWGEFKQAAKTRRSAVRGPVIRMARFELNDRHRGWSTVIIAAPMTYLVSLVAVALTVNDLVPVGGNYVYLAGLFGVVTSFIMFVAWVVWRGRADHRMKEEVHRRVDRAWIHLLFGAHPASDDTLTP